jgi:hypothetical protein
MAAASQVAMTVLLARRFHCFKNCFWGRFLLGKRHNERKIQIVSFDGQKCVARFAVVVGSHVRATIQVHGNAIHRELRTNEAGLKNQAASSITSFLEHPRPDHAGRIFANRSDGISNKSFVKHSVKVPGNSHVVGNQGPFISLEKMAFCQVIVLHTNFDEIVRESCFVSCKWR